MWGVDRIKNKAAYQDGTIVKVLYHEVQIRTSYLVVPLGLISFNTRVTVMARYQLRFSSFVVAP